MTILSFSIIQFVTVVNSYMWHLLPYFTTQNFNIIYYKLSTKIRRLYYTWYTLFVMHSNISCELQTFNFTMIIFKLIIIIVLFDKGTGTYRGSSVKSKRRAISILFLTKYNSTWVSRAVFSEKLARLTKEITELRPRS